MPFALVFFGLVLLIAGVRNTQGDLFSLLKGDFSGQGNFLYWMISIFFIGAIGYVKQLKPVSDAFLVLVVLVLFLNKKGFFAQFQKAIATTTATPNAIATIGVKAA